MAHDREVEWQLDAVDLRPVLRWLEAQPSETLQPAGTLALRDRYLDTEDWRLFRAGITLRIRTTGRRSEATVKSIGTPVEGLQDRRELTEPIRSADPEAVLAAPGEVGRLVRALAGTRKLRELFQLRTRRQVFTLRVDSAVVGELSLDDTTIPVPRGRPVRLQRVEVEVEPAAAESAAPFVDDLRVSCGLSPAAASKFQVGVLATGQAPPAPEDLGPTEVEDGMTVGEVAFAVLRAHFAEFLEHEPGVRLGEDPEQVHDMRVAVRRMRAAMSVFREALPVRSQRLRDELKWVAGQLGEVRDLEVQLEQFREWGRDMSEEDRASLAPLVERLEHRHADARVQVLLDLDSRRYERVVAGMTDMLQRGPLRRSPPSRTPAAVAAPDLVGNRRRKVRKQGDSLDPSSPPEDFHTLRIRTKRLRYAVEFLSPLAPKPSRRYVRQLVALQDCLGEHQDAQVAKAHIREMVDQEDLPVGAVFLLGRVSERYARRAEELRAEFPLVYAGIRGKPWRRLRTALERRREEVLATMPPSRAASLRTAPPPTEDVVHASAAAAEPSGGLTVVRS
jgi:triphosphatase